MDGMKMEWREHTDTWAMQCDMHEMKCANCVRKLTCEVYLSTHTVGYSGSLSTVNGTNCNKKVTKKHHMSSLPIRCHLLYFSGEMGSSTCSPDSRWRRFLRETAARKSGWSRIGAFLPDLFKVRYHCFWYSLNSSGERDDTYVFFWKFVLLWALLFSPSDCMLWFTIHWISEKSIVNTFEMFTLRVNFLAASHPRIPSYMVLFLFFGFAVSSTMIRSFLHHVVRDRVSTQS